MNLTPDTSVAVMQASQSINSEKISTAKHATKVRDEKQLNAVAKDFEAMFMTEMMKPMFEGIKPDKLFGGGKTEEVFKGILLQEYGKIMSETGQLGIADAVKAELIRIQGASIETAENRGKKDAK